MSAGAVRGARFAFVDALRGLAAAAIVLFHLSAARHVEHLEAVLPGWLDRLVRSADLAVAVFFALSGFVIARAVGDRRVDARSASRFLGRRLIRLGPPYWASIALAVATAAYFPSLHPTWPQVAAHVLYLQDLLRVPALSPIYWTLCLEVQFYVVLCVLLACADRVGSRRAVVGVAAVLAVVTTSGGLRLPDAHRWFVACFPTFLAGALAWWALDGTVRRGEFYLWAVLVLLGGGRFTTVAVTTAVLLFEAGRHGGLGRWLAWRPLQALAAISYSLYLTHNPVMAVTATALRGCVPRTAAWETVWLGALLAGVIAVASVCYAATERPALALSRRLRTRAAARRA